MNFVPPIPQSALSFSTPAKPTIYSLPTAPLTLKEVKGVVIQRSYFYMDASLMTFCVHKLGFAPDLPCWVSQEHVSQKLFGDSGVRSLKLTEDYHQQFFLWGTQFSNVHTTFNFEEPAILISNITFPGPEQYFQLMKSYGTSDFQKAKMEMERADPTEAYKIGRKYKMRADWDQVKESVMYQAVLAKFFQDDNLGLLLLSTRDHLLVQLKPVDAYWGTGTAGNGGNMLGKLLMRVRDVLAKAYPDRVPT